mgnify:CR=1 FL=1
MATTTAPTLTIHVVGTTYEQLLTVSTDQTTFDALDPEKPEKWFIPWYFHPILNEGEDRQAQED